MYDKPLYIYAFLWGGDAATMGIFLPTPCEGKKLDWPTDSWRSSSGNYR
jgi:hypothetical protein